ncbi:hypothetical protein M5D96_007882 [Drosophila gunungcola]|uniref:Uncharacterized protein n=1 Tax=Drosophila gunungcola TaxID=103775 RepID=A0A9P9YM15_9MUSC|nr:hypothetical protein M5D96_007882 [Drosophila gunungcola]
MKFTVLNNGLQDSWLIFFLHTLSKWEKIEARAAASLPHATGR